MSSWCGFHCCKSYQIKSNQVSWLGAYIYTYVHTCTRTLVLSACLFSFLLSSSPDRNQTTGAEIEITSGRADTHLKKNNNIPEMRTVIRCDWCQSWQSRSRMAEVRCWLLVLKHCRVVVVKYRHKMIRDLFNGWYVCTQQSFENEGVCRNGKIKGNQSLLQLLLKSNCLNEFCKDGQKRGRACKKNAL